jgi:hypothetical protein
MQDLSVNELADEIRDSLLDSGIDISRTSVRRMVRHFFKYAEMIAEKEDVRLKMFGKDVCYIYPIFDVKGLCEELAIGKPGVVTVDYLHSKNKLSRRVARYLKYKESHLEKELE